MGEMWHSTLTTGVPTTQPGFLWQDTTSKQATMTLVHVCLCVDISLSLSLPNCPPHPSPHSALMNLYLPPRPSHKAILHSQSFPWPDTGSHHQPACHRGTEGHMGRLNAESKIAVNIVHWVAYKTNIYKDLSFIFTLERPSLWGRDSTFIWFTMFSWRRSYKGIIMLALAFVKNIESCYSRLLWC